jgi:hypothetical protein
LIRMIITNDFVMLNFPKTGSSFARKVIKQAYAERNSLSRKVLEKLRICNPSVLELMLPKIDESLHYNIKDQHGTLRQIPKPHRNKPKVSITRNPILRYESTYQFRWWEKHPPADMKIILKRYPRFPNLSFSEYYEMIHIYARQNRLFNIAPRLDIGLHTIQFIQFYFNDPESVFKKIDNAYIKERCFREDIGPISFLHQENLNSELRTFLLHNGFKENQVIFIDSMERINVTEKKKEDSECAKLLLDNDILNTIIERDRLLFEIFPEYLPREFSKQFNNEK